MSSNSGNALFSCPTLIARLGYNWLIISLHYVIFSFLCKEMPFILDHNLQQSIEKDIHSWIMMPEY